MPQAKEGNAMSEGTWENVQTRRRGKVPLLGRGEEEGQAIHKKLLALESAHA